MNEHHNNYNYPSINKQLVEYLIMSKLFFASLLILLSFQSAAFTPKEVCFDQDSEFIGWLTDEECAALNGNSPDDFTQNSEYSHPTREPIAESEEPVVIVL